MYIYIDSFVLHSSSHKLHPVSSWLSKQSVSKFDLNVIHMASKEGKVPTHHILCMYRCGQIK